MIRYNQRPDRHTFDRICFPNKREVVSLWLVREEANRTSMNERKPSQYAILSRPRAVGLDVHGKSISFRNDGRSWEH